MRNRLFRHFCVNLMPPWLLNIQFQKNIQRDFLLHWLFSHLMRKQS